MKKLYLGFIVILLFIAINSANAQENEKQLWYCWEEVVHPTLINEYWELSKELSELCKSEGYSYAFYAWTSGNFKYQYWHPINSLSDIDKLEAEWDKIMAKFGAEKTEKWIKTIKSTNSRTITEISDLSFYPANPRVVMDSVNYMEFQEFYIIPGKGKEFEKMMKKAVAHIKSEGHSDSWHVASGGLGYNGPVYIGWAFDKNKKEYIINDEIFSKKYGDFFKEFNKDFVKILRSVERKEAWFARDLSYFGN
ncbi:hypothetical protein [Maribellus sediminis]|uniref:hypothetical protein n=1 Tax=Maribellus sediminis TaxID=2696285 RepID=UPI001431CB87|nr:hypothetical protein [Maribellus sediminis]